MMMEMSVAGIALDLRNNQPIVVLNDPNKRRALPIWIGLAEASAISLALENPKPVRPLTHDLLLNVIKQLGYRVKQVEINELDAGTYFATIRLEPRSQAAKAPTDQSFLSMSLSEQAIDARPSDAIALAMRAKAPIFVSPEVVAEGTIPADLERDQWESEEMRAFLESVKPSDFKIDGTDKKEQGH